MKREKYLTTLLIICIASYFIMFNMCMTADAEDMTTVPIATNGRLKGDSVVISLKNIYLGEQRLNKYISQISKLKYDECDLLVQECKKNEIDPFIVLGLIKRESNFNPRAVGMSGERGLGQLMENTAKPVAKNLGYIYDPNKLFDTRYNLKLTITQLAYLYNIYEGDINKALTAYNRGQQGLIDYIKEGKSTYNNPAMSDYSVKVLEFASAYKEEFVKLLK